MKKSTLTLRAVAFFFGLALALGNLSAFATVKADVNDFEVTSFAADYFLDKSSSHGHMRVEEKIDVVFSDNNHGIFRALPSSYNGHPLNIKIIKIKRADGSLWPYTSYGQNGNKVLKIGDANHTVTGAQTFSIEYSMDNVIYFSDDHNELYWNINGNQWGQSFKSVSVQLHLAEGLELIEGGNLQPVCYTGDYGSKNHLCRVSTTKRSLSALTTEGLKPGEGLSIVAALPSGTFVQYGLQDTIKEHIVDILLVSFSIATLAVAFGQWFKHGKDHKGRGIVVPQYEPPKGMNVLQAGVLQDYKLDNKDITAALIGFAVKGYIKIIESDSKTLGIFKKTTTKVELVNSNTTGLATYETALLSGLFSDLTVGKTTNLGTYNSALATVVTGLSKTIKAQLTELGYLEKGVSGSVNLLLGGLFVANLLIVGISFSTHSYWGVIAMPVLIIIIVLISLMSRRSLVGVETNEYLKGLKLYIDTVEKDRLAKMQSANAEYANNATQPVRTVELFESLLPYAIIFGLEKTWAKQFENIYNQPPDWYQGNWAAFNAVALTDHIMNTSAAALGSTFTAPNSSGGSGFSGGSGGGGGGGGGGGW